MNSARVSAALALGLLSCSSGAMVAANSGSGTASSSGSPGAGGASGGTVSSSSAGGSPASASSSSIVASSAGSGGGPVASDAGSDGDASTPSVSAPAIPCMDTISQVYTTPTNLPPFSSAVLGDIVWCAFDSSLSVSTVASEVASKGITTPMKTGVNLYRVAYRTTRGDGSAGLSSARVYLPATQAAPVLPVITVGHPTDGIAQSCAPSTDATSNEDLALPWAGLGYAVMVSDYAGLGNGGVQAYLDNHDQAYSVLDGARALRKLLPAASLSSSVLAVGYSQGGGAVLSAQGLAGSYGVDGTLVGVVAFAPEWPSRLNSFGFVNELLNPGELTIETGISENVVTAMREYAYFANRVGLADEGDGFPSGSRTGIDNAIATLCQTPLGGYLQATAPHVGDLFDPTFAATTLACIEQGAADAGIDASDASDAGDAGDASDAGNPDTDAGDAGELGVDAGDGGLGCTDPGLSYYNFLQQNFVSGDPTGAPILYVQGLADVIMPPASEAACNLQKLNAEGVFPQVCVDPEAQHTNIVGRNMDFALSWAFALLAGEPLPTTCSSTGIPTCTP